MSEIHCASAHAFLGCRDTLNTSRPTRSEYLISMIILGSCVATQRIYKVLTEKDAAGGFYVYIYETLRSKSPDRDSFPDKLEMAKAVWRCYFDLRSSSTLSATSLANLSSWLKLFGIMCRIPLAWALRFHSGVDEIDMMFSLPKRSKSKTWKDPAALQSRSRTMTS